MSEDKKRKRRKAAYDEETPEHAFQTARRLFGQLSDQKVRLFFVGVCILVYVALNVYAPYYSAGVIDLLLTTIKNAVESGTKFTMPWQPLGGGKWRCLPRCIF